ncbi:sialate O-acetylesterase [Salmonella enterica]|nr:sialate O-acetylesterase [Salmonella enterica]ECH4009976.1 sialate O-acetylesterase [Salmonella enterica subsp. enterica serovar Montevideo]EBM1330907.1 sialate O-acetylesterase [Salmonella enterica]ECT8738500.1 sialate O-acetylesterase [Salmonella enterica subsp. enterica serovar Montevideo]EHQ4812203.1 sialate O-acetylesterase [Salmonella enterica]
MIIPAGNHLSVGQTSFTRSDGPAWYYVLPVTGQSNGMAYGEGMPLPDTLDAPHPRIKQLARRATVTPGGAACHYNEIIPLDHCPHDVQDMSGMNHPRADVSKGQYGTVSQALHIAKKLLTYIPQDAGILVVPCARGGSAFTQGADGSFSATTGATEASSRWGVGKPLYQDLISRTKAALDSNPKNQLLAVVWMQGEFDMASSGYTQQPALFAAMVRQFRTDLTDYAAQMPDFKEGDVPWICGDTTYYWKDMYPAQYDAVYGAYKTCPEPGVYFVPFLTDEHGNNTPTNEPAEDPDIPAAHYYGAASRSNGNMVSSHRGSHFSSWARRNIIPERLAAAILLYAGRRALLAAPSGGALPTPDTDSTTGGTGLMPVVDNPGYNGRRGDGTLQQQGWKTVTGATFTPVANPDGKGGHILTVSQTAGQVWTVSRPAPGGADLLRYGGELTCRFRLTTPLVASQYAFAIYWQIAVGDVPPGVRFTDATVRNTWPCVMNFFLQTDGAAINLMAQKSPSNLRLGTFGAYNTDWHSFRIVYHGGNTNRATLYIDGAAVGDFSLMNCPAPVTVNTLMLTSITGGNVYGVELEELGVTVYRDDASVTLTDGDSNTVYFPAGTRGGKVILPDAQISAGKAVRVTADNAGTITLTPENSNVLINGFPAAITTDHSVTLIQTGSDGRTWVVT